MLYTVILAANLSGPLPAGTELDTLFWDCEYATTRTVLDSDEAAFCSQVYERLKAEKFRGSFSELLTWWRKTKEIEYTKRMKKRQ